MKNFKNVVSFFFLALFVSCADMTKEVEDSINKLNAKTEKLDSIVNQELKKVNKLDSIIIKEGEKVKKLDSLIDKSSLKIDSIAKSKINLLKGRNN